MNEEKENLKGNSRSFFTLLDLAFIFMKYRKKILIVTSIICIISIILYFFVFHLIYYSVASVKSTAKTSGLLSSFEGLSDLGSIEDIGLGGGKSARELATYEEILQSRRCLEPLIIKFNLLERDNFRFMEDAVKNFRHDNLVLNEERLAGVLYVGVYDKDPVIAKEMVDFLLSQLDKINIEMNVQNAKNNREFIEKRYNQAKEDLTKAEDTLKSFQMIYGVAPDLQIKAAAESAFTLEAEMKTEEVKLDILKKILSPDQLEVRTQEAKVNSLRDQVNKIRNSTNLNDFLRLGNSPQIAMGFLRLQREVEIQSKIQAFLLPLYEQAKIEEKKETPTIIVLDKPYIAERKTKPKRLLMTLLITFLGFVFSLSYAALYEYFKLQKTKGTFFGSRFDR